MTQKQLAPRLLMLLVCLGITNVHADTATDPLILGVFPRRNIQTTTALFTPLATYLSRELKRPVKFETSYDFAAFWEQVERKHYDIVHYNQYHYLLSHKRDNYQVIVKNEEFGSATIAGAIVVRKDAGIHSVRDLKGKKIVFGGDRMAMQAYISATYLLRMAGLKPGDYFEQFALNPPKAAIATFYQQAAAAGTGDHVLALSQVTQEITADSMEYLAKSKPIAQLPWAVKSDLPVSLIVQIKHLLTNLHDSDEGRQLLKQMRLSNILPASDSDYDSCRQIIKTVLNQDL